MNIYREPDSKPTFSFNLRPRLIQEGIGCKLICCVNGKPQPKVIDHLTPRYLDLLDLLLSYLSSSQVQWFKDRTQLGDNDSHYLTSFVHGVCTLEITACETSDSALYRCQATNPLGTDETTCLVHVEGKATRRRRSSVVHAVGFSRSSTNATSSFSSSWRRRFVDSCSIPIAHSFIGQRFGLEIQIRCRG